MNLINANKSKKSGSSLLQNNWVILLIIVLLGLLSRIPYRTEYLYHWDSVNFAYGMSEFNLAMEQPHPPGYLLYVWLSDLVNLLVHDQNASLVWIAVFASALSLGVIYLLGEEIFNRKVGLISAALLFASPLYWFYGEIALPHTLDALLVLSCVWGLFRVWKGEFKFIYLATILLSLAGGFRPQTLVFLFPLTFVVFLKTGFKRFAMAAILGSVLCLAWFVPLIQLSGGLREYLDIMGAFSDRFQINTSVLMGAGLGGVTYNLKKLIPYTLYAMGAGLFGLLFWLIYLIRDKVKLFNKTSIFFVLWILPVLLYYTFIHMGQQGLIFVYLPALCIIAALGLEKIFKEKKRFSLLLAGGLVFINILVFLVMPEYPLGPDTQRFLTLGTLRNSDAYYSARFDYIFSEFDPENTLIVAEDWRHAEFYLPEYAVLRINGTYVENPQITSEVGLFFDEEKYSLLNENDNEVRIIIFEPGSGQIVIDNNGMSLVTLSDRTWIGVLILKPGDSYTLK